MKVEKFRNFLRKTPIELKNLRDALSDSNFSSARSLANLLRERGIEIHSHSFWYTAFKLEVACRKELLEEALLHERRLTREFQSARRRFERLPVYGDVADEDAFFPKQASHLSPQDVAAIVRLNSDRFRNCIDELIEGNPGPEMIRRARSTLSAINDAAAFLDLHAPASSGSDAENVLEEVEWIPDSSSSVLWSVFFDLADLQSRTVSLLTETCENPQAPAIAFARSSSPLAPPAPLSHFERHGLDLKHEVT